MHRLSIVVPVYQDELSIRQNFLTLKGELDKFGDHFSCEFILVNDGSRDNSTLVLEQIHAEYPNLVGVLNFTRNFGQLAAIVAGLSKCTGDCVAVISSDLQDPPELIPRMFNEWQKGAPTVIGVRQTRDDPLFARFTSRLFYRLMRRYALPTIPATGFDFFLVDRRVAERIANSSERNTFLQGQILSASEQFVQIPYNRRARQVGRSGWTLLKKLKYFVDGFVAYSFTPIRLISLFGIVIFAFAVILSLGLILDRLFRGTEMPGWTSVMVALLLLHGFELLAIGVVGEYVWRALDQVRGRPLYLISYYKPPVHPNA